MNSALLCAALLAAAQSDPQPAATSTAGIPDAATPEAPAAGNWPRYLGPEGTAVAPWPEATFAWPEAGPKVLWRQPIGGGYGGAAVADGEVYLFDHERNERDVLRVFDLDSGEELWSAGYAQEGRLNFDGSRTVPTIVGDRVYTTSGFGPVACFDREARELLWKVDVEESLGGRKPMFGWCVHPVVFEDLVLAAPLNEDVGLVALDRATGEVRWRSEHLGYTHSSPTLVQLAGRWQLLFNVCERTASGRDEPAPSTLWSLDPATGEPLWRHDLTLCGLPVPQPVLVGEDRIFMTGGYRAGSVLLDLQWTAEGDAPRTVAGVTEAFRSTRGSQMHQPIVRGGHVYALVNENWTDGRRRRDEGGLVCFDLEGNERWRTGAEPNFGRGGMVLVADAFLIQDGYKGTLVAARATPAGYEELGRFDPFEIRARDGQLWAPPAVSGTRILMRSQDELVCVELAPGD